MIFIIFIFGKSKFELCILLIIGMYMFSLYVFVNNSLFIYNVVGLEGNVYVDMIFYLSGLEFGNILILLLVYNILLKR